MAQVGRKIRNTWGHSESASKALCLQNIHQSGNSPCVACIQWSRWEDRRGWVSKVNSEHPTLWAPSTWPAKNKHRPTTIFCFHNEFQYDSNALQIECVRKVQQMENLETAFLQHTRCYKSIQIVANMVVLENNAPAKLAEAKEVHEFG